MRLPRLASSVFLALWPGAVVVSLLLAGLVPTGHAPLQTAFPALGLVTATREFRPLAPAAGLTAGLSSVASIPIPGWPIGLTYDSTTGTLDVLGADNNLTLVHAQNDTVVRRIALPVDGYPYSPPTAEVYDHIDNLVYVAQWTTGLCTGCGGPVTLALNASTGSVVGTNWNLTGLDVPDYLSCLVFVPSIDVVDACDQRNPGRVVELQGATNAIRGTLQVGLYPSAATLDPSSGLVYMANWGSDNVTVFDPSTNAIVGWIPAGVQPAGLALDTATGQLFVANNASDNVTIINTATEATVASVSVGCNPGAIAYDSADGDVYVANSCSNNLTAISGATDTVVGSVLVGSYPDAILFDGANQRVYVANEGSSNVSVLATTAPPVSYSVTFTESGLPVGMNWSATLNGSASFSVSSSIGFVLANGTYAYVIAPHAGYVAVPSAGTLTVDGSPVSERITFARETPPSYAVTFTESGLPLGTQWSVSLNGTTDASPTTSIKFNETNGTYPFSVSPPTGYTAGPDLGNVTVSGGPANQTITFHPTVGSRIQVNFVESGLPNGTGWSITFNGETLSGVAPDVIVFGRNAGTYAFTVGNVSGFVSNVTSGSVTARPAAVAVFIGFSPAPGRVASLSNGLPLADWILIGAGISAAAIVGAAFAVLARRRRRSPPAGPAMSASPPPG